MLSEEHKQGPGRQFHIVHTDPGHDAIGKLLNSNLLQPKLCCRNQTVLRNTSYPGSSYPPSSALVLQTVNASPSRLGHCPRPVLCQNTFPGFWNKGYRLPLLPLKREKTDDQANIRKIYTVFQATFCLLSHPTKPTHATAPHSIRSQLYSNLQKCRRGRFISGLQCQYFYEPV